MGKRQPIGLELDVAKQQQVQVERPWAVPRPGEHAPLLGLDRLAGVEEILRLEGGRDPGCRVQEVGLVENLADGLGLVEGGDRVDPGAVLGEQADGRPQVLLPVADVGAEPQVAGAGLGVQSESSSASAGSSSGVSRVTSTATSSIASGRGGSGLAARTVTVWHA